MAIKCYVLAADQAMAESAAWDLDWTTDQREEADKYPDTEARPVRLYEVTISAKRKRAAKKGGKS
jgi:hypothetical protein